MAALATPGHWRPWCRLWVHALLLGDRQRLEKPVQQPAFAAPHRPVQVQAAGGLAGQQVLGFPGQGGNGAGLTGAQGVALLLGLLLKERGNGRGVEGVGLVAEQATDQGKRGQCKSLCISVVAHFRALAAF